MHNLDFKIFDKVIYDYYGDTSIKVINTLEDDESKKDQWDMPYRFAILDSGERVRTCFLKKA